MAALTGGWEGAAPLVAVAASWAVFAWFASGCDAAGGLARLMRVAGGLVAAARAALAASARRLGAGERSDGRVSLGDVSEMTDIVRLGLAAGLSFDASLALYCENRDDELARLLERARMSWQMGMVGREEALMGVARASGVRALESFAAAVGQALALGAPLAETLASQGRECRAAHRAEVERRIEQAPVKLLIPTGTLILPALLLSILGPLLAASGMI